MELHFLQDQAICNVSRTYCVCGPWSLLWVASNQRKIFFFCSLAVPIVDVEILSHNVSPSGILKAGGSLLKVTSYEIFSMLFASGCQIRLIENTIS